MSRLSSELQRARRAGLMKATAAAACCFAVVLSSGCGTTRASSQPWMDADALTEARLARHLLADRQTNEWLAAKSESPGSGLLERLTLPELLKVAAEHSPMVKAAYHKWQAAAQKYPQAFTLPDPMVSGRYYVRQMAPEEEKWELMVSQAIPYPGKLVIAGKIADKEAQAAFLRYQAATRNALTDTKEMYFELYYIDRAKSITGEIRKLYERYAALAAGGLEVAKPKLPEQFRAESQREQLGYDLILLDEMRSTEAARLGAMLAWPRGRSLGPTEDVSDPADLRDSLDSLLEIAERYNQELAAAGVEVERSILQSKYARRAPIPDLSVSASYMRTGEMPDGSDPTRDPVTVGVGISIPLWVNKYKAMAREASEMEKAALAEEEAQRQEVRAALAKAYFSLRNSSRLVRLYRDTLIPQARQALQSAEELYRKGEANLASVLETTATVHNFELARLRATADFYQNLARVERVLGTAFEPVAGGAGSSGGQGPAGDVENKEPAP